MCLSVRCTLPINRARLKPRLGGRRCSRACRRIGTLPFLPAALGGIAGGSVRPTRTDDGSRKLVLATHAGYIIGGSGSSSADRAAAVPLASPRNSPRASVASVRIWYIWVSGRTLGNQYIIEHTYYAQ